MGIPHVRGVKCLQNSDDRRPIMREHIEELLARTEQYWCPIKHA